MSFHRSWCQSEQSKCSNQKFEETEWINLLAPYPFSTLSIFIKTHLITCCLFINTHWRHTCHHRWRQQEVSCIGNWDLWQQFERIEHVVNGIRDFYESWRRWQKQMSSCVCKISFKSVQVCGGCCKMFRGLTFFGTQFIIINNFTLKYYHAIYIWKGMLPSVVLL